MTSRGHSEEQGETILQKNQSNSGIHNINFSMLMQCNQYCFGVLVSWIRLTMINCTLFLKKQES